MRPRAEQRSGVGAQRRPPQCEPWPETACREARAMQTRVFDVVLSKDPSASHPDRPRRLGSAIDCLASHGADQ
jgi:hypothetical protein